MLTAIVKTYEAEGKRYLMAEQSFEVSSVRRYSETYRDARGKAPARGPGVELKIPNRKPVFFGLEKDRVHEVIVLNSAGVVVAHYAA